MTVWGKKLLQNLVVLILMLQNILPAGSGTNSLCEGWEGSFTMEEVLRAWKMSWMERREAPMILSAVLTVHCRVLGSDALQFPDHTVMQPARMLSTVPL